MLRFIEKLPTIPVLLIGAWMVVAPFTPEPHLLEKVRWLIEGLPFRPMDVFDLFLLGGLGVVAALKLWCVLGKKCGDKTQPVAEGSDG